MGRPSIAQLQEQVQLLKEEEGIVDQPEKIVLQDAAAVKHKLDHTAGEASSIDMDRDEECSAATHVSTVCCLSYAEQKCCLTDCIRGQTRH